MARCLTAGQVFRWREVRPGVWAGVDGGDWFWVSESSGGYEVVSSGGYGVFGRLFGLNEDLGGRLRALVDGDQEWERLIGRSAGLRLMRPSCAVEETFSFLCTSNNHLKRILPMVDWLGRRGELLGEYEGVEFWRFPELEVISGIGESELREAGFGYRGGTIPLVARGILERGGREWLEGLRSVRYVEAFEALMMFPGVGPKLADCVCLFALGHGEAVPVDTHVWQQVTRRFFPEWEGKAVTAGRYRAVGDLLRGRFGDLAGAAHQLLFVEGLWRR